MNEKLAGKKVSKLDTFKDEMVGGVAYALNKRVNNMMI